MKKLYLIGNLKMNGSHTMLKSHFEYILEASKYTENVVGFATPSVYLPLAKEVFSGSEVLYGAQNIYPKESGAFTGETSVNMVKDYNGTFTLVGHSERRQFFGETNEQVNEKVLFALNNGLNVVLCIGETLNERNQNQTEDVLKTQLKQALNGVSKQQLETMFIAYEPVWAIGTGVSASVEDVQVASKFITEFLQDLYNDKNLKIKLLYGGSLNENNADTLLKVEHIHGGLIGGASLNSQSFEKIINTKIEE